MNFYTDDKTIIACSTGTQSNTAIAVLRLSGFKNLIDLQNFFSFDLAKTINRKSHLTNIIFEDKVFDNGLLVFFPEGASYTGENVLELSIHGNQLNIQRIISLFISKGDCRSAAPGEFTYRALKNKKLSLSQVEGLDMLLNANSSLMLSQGLDILQGDLHAQYLAVYDAYLKLKAAIEISIDFSEDVGAEETQKLFQDSFDKFFKLISSLKTRTEGNISSLLSPEIVLVGQTNAGKSSLFNILLKHDRSIVSSIAGTTRDYISEVIHIDGTNFKLVDTAGIRESSDLIENIGIDRAMNILGRSFFKILIVNPYETNPEYLAKFNDVNFDILILSHSDKKDFLEVLSNIDLSQITTKIVTIANFDTIHGGSIGPVSIAGPMGPLIDHGPIEPPFKNDGPIEPLFKNTGPIEPLFKNNGPIEPPQKNISPMKNEKEVILNSDKISNQKLSRDFKSSSGPIEPLENKNKIVHVGPLANEFKQFGPIGPIISKTLTGPTGPIEPAIKAEIQKKFDLSIANNPILLERHRDVINKIYINSIEFSNNIRDLSDVAILSSEVNILGHSLVELVGIVSPDDVLNSIFENFCIGK